MSPRNPFETLKDFQKVIESTAVSIKGRPAAGLNIGLSLAVRYFQDLKKTGNKAIFIGNGGSSAIASHQALDLWNHGKVRAIAFNDAPLITCMANDFGYENVFARPMEMYADPGDLLIAISSSGKSPNILRAARIASEKKCKIIGLSGFHSDNPLSHVGDLHFYVPSISYGIVEVAHFLLCHAIIDEFVRLSKMKGSKATKRKTNEKATFVPPLRGNAPYTTS